MAFSLGVVQAASAADMPVKAQPMTPPPAAYNWTGCYLGAQVGYGWGKSKHSFDRGAPADNSNPRGWVSGGRAGCNYQFPSSNFVVGVEGDYEGANLHGDFVNATAATSVGSARMKSDGSIRGRLGWAWDRSRLYVTGGWAFARYDFGGGPYLLRRAAATLRPRLAGRPALPGHMRSRTSSVDGLNIATPITVHRAVVCVRCSRGSPCLCEIRLT